MAKVYISSTYSDLIEERLAAVQAVLRLRQHAIAMEHYVATDQRPLAKCRKDVMASDIYVGIIGWRYGFVPEGEQFSITHLELQAATEVNIPRLIFLKHPDSRQDSGESVDCVAKLNALREQLAAEYVVSFFSSVAELEALVTAAVSNTLVDLAQRQAGPRAANGVIPQLLPYLANRSEQELELRNAWKDFAKLRSLRPFLLISHGNEEEAHDWFLERLCEVSLPRLIHGASDGLAIEKQLVKWPPRNLDPADCSDYFRETIADRLTGSADAEPGEISARIAGTAPLLLHSLLLTEDWQHQGQAYLEALIDFWSTFPYQATDKNRPVIILVCLQYQSGRDAGFFERRRINKLNAGIRTYLDKLSKNQPDDLQLLVFSELSAVQQQDVEEWAHLEAVGNWCNVPALIREVRNLYRDQKKNNPDGHIPMEDLGLALEELIRAHQRT